MNESEQAPKQDKSRKSEAGAAMNSSNSNLNTTGTKDGGKDRQVNDSDVNMKKNVGDTTSAFPGNSSLQIATNSKTRPGVQPSASNTEPKSSNANSSQNKDLPTAIEPIPDQLSLVFDDTKGDRRTILVTANEKWFYVVEKYVSGRKISNDDKGKVKMSFDGERISKHSSVAYLCDEHSLKPGSVITVDCSQIEGLVPRFDARDCNYQDVKEYLIPETTYPPITLREKDMVVYYILDENDLPYFEAVDYVGTSVEDNVWECFLEHCAKKGRHINLRQHRVVIFKRFTWESFDSEKFLSPSEEALAYELLIGRFFETFRIKFSQCKPGVGSEECNARLLKKLEGEEYTNEVFKRTCEILTRPDFVNGPLPTPAKVSSKRKIDSNTADDAD